MDETRQLLKIFGVTVTVVVHRFLRSSDFTLRPCGFECFSVGASLSKTLGCRRGLPIRRPTDS